MKSILNSKGNFYCTLCSNIKISKRTSGFINFLLRLVRQLICDVLKTNFWTTAYWFSWILPGNACSNSKCICPGSKRKKKINFNSQRTRYWCRSVNTRLFCTKIIKDLKKFSRARILLVTLSNQLNSKSTKTLCWLTVPLWKGPNIHSNLKAQKPYFLVFSQTPSTYI